MRLVCRCNPPRPDTREAEDTGALPQVRRAGRQFNGIQLLPPKRFFSIWLQVDPYYNLPPEQRAVQRLVEQFNADERLWKKLEPRRRARRKLRPRLSHTKLKELDLREFAKAKPPQDCIGQWVTP